MAVELEPFGEPTRTAKALSLPIDWTLEGTEFSKLADQVLNVPGNGVGPPDGDVAGRAVTGADNSPDPDLSSSKSTYKKRSGSAGKVVSRADDAILCERLLANLYAVSIEQQLTSLGVHLNADWYAKHKASLPPFVGKRRFLRIYSRLFDLGLIQHHAKGFGGVVSTRVLPTAKLLLLFEQCGPIRLRQDMRGLDVIELRAPAQKVQRVASRGKRAGQKVTLRITGAPMVFADTEYTTWAGREMRRINDYLQAANIGWADTPEAHSAWQEMTTGRDGKRRLAPNMNKVRLKRIYNRDLSTGGRMYGGWWQLVPSEHRKHITINGKATRELDWEALHLRLCYAIDRQPAPYMERPGQWYELPGVPNRWRKLVKLLTNQMLNCSTDEQAIKAAMDERKKQNKPSDLELWRAFKAECIKRSGGKNSGAIKAELVRWTQLIRVRHAAIATWFDNPDSGGTLQWADSGLLETVLRVAIKAGIVALPIHDSVIVVKRDVAAMRKIMHETFNYGAAGGIFGQIGNAIKEKDDE